MSTSPSSRRRLWWAAPLVLVLVVALVWLRAAGDEESDGEHAPPAAVSGPPSPGSEPSSGPTGTPEPGSLDEVPVEEVPTVAAVPLTETVVLQPGLTLRIARVEEVEGVARGVGEIAGPALRLTLELSNETGSEVPVDSAVVDLLAGPRRTPAATLTGPGGRAFEGVVAPGRAVTGVYVFGVPPRDRDRVRVSVSYRAGMPAAVFTGAVA